MCSSENGDWTGEIWESPDQLQSAGPVQSSYVDVSRQFQNLTMAMTGLQANDKHYNKYQMRGSYLHRRNQGRQAKPDSIPDRLDKTPQSHEKQQEEIDERQPTHKHLASPVYENFGWQPFYRTDAYCFQPIQGVNKHTIEQEQVSPGAAIKEHSIMQWPSYQNK